MPLDCSDLRARYARGIHRDPATPALVATHVRLPAEVVAMYDAHAAWLGQEQGRTVSRAEAIADLAVRYL